MIKGNKIELVPANLEDRRKVYEWCFHSETSASHSGSPNYPGIAIPNYGEFCDDYVDYFFTGTEPNKGRGFFIMHNEEAVRLH